MPEATLQRALPLFDDAPPPVMGASSPEPIAPYDPDADARFSAFCRRTGRSREEALALVERGVIRP